MSEIVRVVALLGKPSDAALATVTPLGGRWYRPPSPAQGILTVAKELREVGMAPSV